MGPFFFNGPALRYKEKLEFKLKTGHLVNANPNLVFKALELKINSYSPEKPIKFFPCNQELILFSVSMDAKATEKY